MGLLSVLFEWKAASRDKKVARHRLQGTCPDCRGSGFHAMVMNEFAYLGSLDDYKCSGCAGSGLFSDWESG